MKFKDDAYKERYKLFFIGYFALMIGVAFLRFPDIKNELKYFLITDQMIDSQNFIILKYFNELYPDKPPIYFWLLGLARAITSSSFYPMALIVANIIPGAITAILSFKIARLFWTEKMAYISTAIFVTLPFVFGTALVLRMDALMTTFITGAFYLFFSSYMKRNIISPNRYLYLYVWIALGILVKGGAAFIIPALTIVCYLYLNKNLSYLKTIKPLEGLGVIIIILGVWFLGILSFPEGKDYIGLLIGQETMGRVVRSKSHVRPFYYYLLQLPLTTLPIMPFFFMGVFSNLRNFKNRYKWKNVDKMAFSIFIPNLIFFSLISGKLDIYLLPLYFGVVIISLRAIEKKWSGKKEKIYKILLYINCGVFLICAAALPYYNKNYTLKDSIDILKENSETVYSYRFGDAQNISKEINKENIEELSLEDLNKVKEGELIITRDKYKKNIPSENFKEIYSNKEYAIFISENL
jgi:4-amino-4-deoxy-L-arabinose transferase-like glycosyltransferase